MRPLWELASAFLQIGIVAFGGGLSTLPLIRYQIVYRTGWLTEQQFSQVLSLSQVTPGPIAINAATFVGYQQAGFWGSLISTLSIAAAPIAVLTVVLTILQNISAEHTSRFKSFLRPVVSGLLTLCIISPLKTTIGNGAFAIAMFTCGVALVVYCKFIREHPAVMLFLFGALGSYLLA